MQPQFRKNHGWVSQYLFWFLFLLPVGAMAADAVKSSPLPAPVKRLQHFLDRVKTLEADFVQRIENSDSGLPSENSGHVMTAKPGRFRWDYRTPILQTIVSDGQTIWFHEPDLAQVTVSKATRLDHTPAVLLSSNIALQTLFTWKISEDPVLKLPVVHLLPIKEGSVTEIALVLHPDRDTLLKFTTHDSLGHISHFTFDNMRINQTIAESHFQFKIPANVDIIEERAQPSDPP